MKPRHLIPLAVICFVLGFVVYLLSWSAAR